MPHEDVKWWYVTWDGLTWTRSIVDMFDLYLSLLYILRLCNL